MLQLPRGWAKCPYDQLHPLDVVCHSNAPSLDNNQAFIGLKGLGFSSWVVEWSECTIMQTNLGQNTYLLEERQMDEFYSAEKVGAHTLLVWVIADCDLLGVDLMWPSVSLWFWSVRREAFTEGAVKTRRSGASAERWLAEPHSARLALPQSLLCEFRVPKI